MEPKRITDRLSVSPQINPSDVKALKEAGFKGIICNRPDGEGADQPSFEEIERAAKKAGLEARYIPITSGMVKDGRLVVCPGLKLDWGKEWMAKPEALKVKVHTAE